MIRTAHPNKALFRQLLEAWGRGDRDATARFFAEDAIFSYPGRGPLHGEYRAGTHSSASGRTKTANQPVGSSRSSSSWLRAIATYSCSPEGTRLRLRAVRPGVVVGEIAMYTGVPRMADVLAEMPSVVLRLSKASIERLEAEEPELAAALHRWLATTLAERLGDTRRSFDALLDCGLGRPGACLSHALGTVRA